MTKEKAIQLITKYNAGQCTKEEKTLVEGWYEKYNDHDLDITQERIEAIGDEIYKILPRPESKTKIIKLWSIVTAASISLIAISILIFYQRNESISKHNKLALEIVPGGNKATLTLANGKTINLSNTQKGVIIDTDKITYNNGTTITADNADDAPGLATITTPRGGTYQITLPDGTKVWLNAASSLTYSTSLNERGEDRSVTLSGEAYFEVFKDKNRAFVVSTRLQEVLVLGTHFNINAYESDQTKTTLLEGSVKVQISSPRAKRKSKVLIPGEQSEIKGESINVSKVNTSIELAWKKGKIQFVRADLKSVMKMISRWYDIEVIYKYYPIGGKFTGSISRSKNISEVLNLLETTGDVRFKIEERKVLVMK